MLFISAKVSSGKEQGEEGDRENHLSQSLSTKEDKEDFKELSSNLCSEPAHGCCASCSRSSALPCCRVHPGGEAEAAVPVQDSPCTFSRRRN